MLKPLVLSCRHCTRCRTSLCFRSTPTTVIPNRGIFRTSPSVFGPIQFRAERNPKFPTWHGKQVHSRCLASHAPLPIHSEPLSVSDVPLVSALYVDHFDFQNTTVVDVDLNLGQRFEDVATLVDNVTARGMTIDVHQLVSNYRIMMSKLSEKTALEEERDSIASQMKTLVKAKKGSEMEKAALRQRGKEVRELLKMVTRVYYDVEKDVMLAALQLPVELHPSTPAEDEVIIEVNERPVFSFPVKDHMTIGRESKTLTMSSISRGAYYLCGPLAHLELRLTDLVTRRLRHSGLQPFSCPDMFKTIVMEACGTKFTDPDKVFSVQPKPTSDGLRQDDGVTLDKLGNILYLAGVSPMSFAAYLTRMTIDESYLPLRYFAQGRRYSPEQFDPSVDAGLLGARQATVVEMFAASSCVADSEDVYEDYRNILWTFYSQLELPVRLVNVGSSNLQHSEAARTDIKVWMPSTHSFVKVADVKMCHDFVSRRLMMKCTNDSDNERFLHTVHGTAVCVPMLLAAIMENKQTEMEGFTLPSCCQT